MGSDIHTLAEVRKGKRWVAVKRPVFTDWFNGTTATPFSDRNYELFAKLANVREYRGDGHPLAYPRGVPANASPEWVAEVERWNGDFHSHSWFTVAELRSVDWVPIDEGFARAVEVMGTLGDPDDVRLVFAFDN